MNQKSHVLILMPALNEGNIITQTINDCYKNTHYIVDVLVVIDNKIHPETLKAIRKTKAKILDIGKGSGKGTAIRKAIPYCNKHIIVQLDADYQFLPSELSKLVEPLLSGTDVTLGTRYQKGSHIDNDSVSLIKLFGSYGLSTITSIFAKKRVTDVMAGYKGFAPGILQKLDPHVDHFGYEAELVIKAAKQKMIIKNIPISYKKRAIGTSNVNSIKHGLLVLQTILDVGMS